MKLDVICLETEAYYKLIQEIVDIVKDQNQQEDLWCDGKKAQEILNVKRSTLQKLRDQQVITISQLSRKNIRYYIPSLYEYLESKIVK